MKQVGGWSYFRHQGLWLRNFLGDFSCRQSVRTGCDFVENHGGNCSKCSMQSQCSLSVIRHSSPSVLNVRAVVSCLEEMIHIERSPSVPPTKFKASFFEWFRPPRVREQFKDGTKIRRPCQWSQSNWNPNRISSES